MANNNIETRVSDLEIRMAVQDEKFNAFMQEMRDFKTEMRDRDNQRAAEIRDLRQEMRDRDEQRAAEIRDLRRETDRKIERIESKFDQMEAKIDSISKYSHQMFIAVAVGIGAMILTVVAPLIIGALRAG